MKIAIIGGIGSGKSEVLSIARNLGFVCLSADEINKELLQSEDYIRKIENNFPNCVSGGVVDKAQLSTLIFSDKEKRELLNSIAHPEIMKKVEECNADPLIVELPLIVESGAKEMFDEIVYVSAPIDMRMRWLKDNRGLSFSKSLEIFNAQVKHDELDKIATKKIVNRKGKAELKENALKIFDEILGDKIFIKD